MGYPGAYAPVISVAASEWTDEDRASRVVAAAGKFMWTMGGDLGGFEEATRALYAKKWDVLKTLTDPWPKDIKAYLRQILAPVNAVDDTTTE
jgi:uncharacterized protein